MSERDDYDELLKKFGLEMGVEVESDGSMKDEDQELLKQELTDEELFLKELAEEQELEELAAKMNVVEEEIDPECFAIFKRFSDDFILIELLGEGAYGRVYRCRHKIDGGEYAVKMVSFMENDRENTLSEAIAFRMAQHPQVVQYHQCWIEHGVVGHESSSSDKYLIDLIADPEEGFGYSSTFFIAMEYCPSTLTKKIMECIPRDKKFQWFQQLMEGLSYFHDKGVEHMNLKSDNIFIDECGKLKIGDFGSADIKEDNEEKPPNLNEELKGNLSSPSFGTCDIVAAGYILLEMSCSPLTSDAEKARLVRNVDRGSFPVNVESDDRTISMLKVLLTNDPKTRIGAKEFLRRFPVND